MRDTFEFIDGATDNNDELRHVLYELAAQTIASQAFSLACATLQKIDEQDCRRLIEQVSDYPGVTARYMTDERRTMVGERACEILMSLSRMRPGFAPPRP